MGKVRKHRFIAAFLPGFLLTLAHIPMPDMFLSDKPYLFALLILPAAASAYADNEQTAQQLRFDTRQTLQMREQQALTPDTEPAGNVLRINGENYAVGNNAAELSTAIMIAINHRQPDDVERLLQRYRALPEYDTAMAGFAEAAISRLRGDLASAAVHYESALAEQPDFVRARLDFARTLFDDRRDGEAQAQFEQLLETEMPPVVHKNVQGHLKALNIRNDWHVSVSAGPVYNSNVQESPGKTEVFRLQIPTGETVEYEQSTPPPESAWGFGYDAALSKRWPLAGHHALWLRGLLYGTHYEDYLARSEDTVNLAAGYQWASARHSWSVAPVWEWNQTGNHRLYHAAGARAEWQYSPKSNLGISIEAEHKKMNYAENYRHNNGSLGSLYATLSYAPDANLWLYGGVDIQQRKTQEPANDYRQYGMRIGAVRQWGDTANLHINAALRRRNYAAFHPWLQVQRRDYEQIYSASLKIPRWKIGGFIPAFTFKHTRVNSNADWLAGYRKNEMMVKWSRFF